MQIIFKRETSTNISLYTFDRVGLNEVHEEYFTTVK